MVLTDNNLPSYGKSNMQPLFAPSGAKPAAPGDFGVTGSGVIAPNPQIFSTEWENVEWKNFTDPQTRGTKLVEYAELTTNTVANPAYGTQGGQLVSLVAIRSGQLIITGLWSRQFRTSRSPRK